MTKYIWIILTKNINIQGILTIFKPQMILVLWYFATHTIIWSLQFPVPGLLSWAPSWPPPTTKEESGDCIMSRHSARLPNVTMATLRKRIVKFIAHCQLSNVLFAYIWGLRPVSSCWGGHRDSRVCSPLYTWVDSARVFEPGVVHSA